MNLLQPTVYRLPRIPPLKYHLGAIFVHIPKAAGTSVHAFLAGAVLVPWAAQARKTVIDAFVRDSFAWYPAIYSKHIKAVELRQLVGHDTWQRAYKFTLVRNPWATMVSSYFWWLQKAHRFRYLARRVEQVRAMGGFRPFLFSELGRTMINECPGTMSDWFSERGCDIVDFVGRVETLDHDMQIVLSQMGATCAETIPGLNTSEHGDYRDYYDCETKAMVAARFGDIIDRFKYRF